jgi:2-polyprenyl-3-methyl-5-hydroxy-6-metoxy-1,4-benzoquinol methylase
MDWNEQSSHGDPVVSISFIYQFDEHELQYWPKVTHDPAHFLRARSARRHLQYMNGRHTRNKRVMKRVSNAVMTRECHADVMRMLC